MPGYFPYELKDEYPDGVMLKAVAILHSTTTSGSGFRGLGFRVGFIGVNRDVYDDTGVCSQHSCTAF